MNQKEHIATLCALGTLGAAASGVAFASEHRETDVSRPGKRKYPGSSYWRPSTARSFLSEVPRRSISLPETANSYNDDTLDSTSSQPSPRISFVPRATSTVLDDKGLGQPSSSRDSSKSRRSNLQRGRMASSLSTTDQRDSTSTPNWLKRLSSFSTSSRSPAPSEIYSNEKDILSPLASQRPATSTETVPNKLVKRSFSQRGVSHQEAHGQILRRPATSHQRSQTFRNILDRPSTSSTAQRAAQQSMVSDTSLAFNHPNQRISWRPYFEPALPRKRRKSETAVDDGNVVLIAVPINPRPSLVLGSDLVASSILPEERAPSALVGVEGTAMSNVRRMKRSLSSVRRMARRRNHTDPSVSVSHSAAQGTLSTLRSVTDPAPVSTITETINFDTERHADSPQFPSSPPFSAPIDKSLYWHRTSICPSDPPTTSSDAEGRVFSDTESMDLHSDTAYDSIATRATNISNQAPTESKLETIFAARTSDELGAHSDMWNNLRHVPSHHEGLTDVTMTDPCTTDEHVYPGSVPRSISVATAADNNTMVTPPRPALDPDMDLNATPVPLKTAHVELHSSPPAFTPKQPDADNEGIDAMFAGINLVDNDDDDIAWSVEGDENLPDLPQAFSSSRQIMSSPIVSNQAFLARFQEPQSSDGQDDDLLMRPSVFPWAERQQTRNFSRPKTVEGKHINGYRRRSSSKKGFTPMHFRSQSVPVNREGGPDELDPASKYQTWRLGAKPVSEEWSDDFEFDEGQIVEIASPVVHEGEPNFRDSVRSVRIPKAIMDRQPSVHLQFGQVQEFMGLVEELKRLRLRGSELQLLHGAARSLWEDADSIINLATINDEEDSMPPMMGSSPASSDPFAELPSLQLTNVPPRRPNMSGRRSVSAMTPPQLHGRARGESLAHARQLIQVMHENREGPESSPRDIEIHRQKKLPFDTQDLKDLVIRSGAVTRALKEEIRRAEGLSPSPRKTPPRRPERQDDHEHPLSEIFKAPPPSLESSPLFHKTTKPTLPKSRSANSYLESSRHPNSGPFSSPITLAAAV